MEFKDYLRIFKKRFRWFFLVFATVLLFYALHYAMQKKYEVASSTIAVNAQISDIAFQLAVDLPLLPQSRYSLQGRLKRLQGTDLQEKYARVYEAFLLMHEKGIKIPETSEVTFDKIDMFLKGEKVSEAEIEKVANDMKSNASYSFSQTQKEGSEILVEARASDPLKASLLDQALVTVAYLDGMDEAARSIKGLQQLLDKEIQKMEEHLEEKNALIRKKYFHIDEKLGRLDQILTQIEENQDTKRDQLALVSQKINAFQQHLHHPGELYYNFGEAQFKTADVQSLENQVAESQARLRVLLQTKTEWHPDVIEQKAKIRVLGQELTRKRKEAKLSYFKDLLDQAKVLEHQLVALADQHREKSLALARIESEHSDYAGIESDIAQLKTHLQNRVDLQERCRRYLALRRGFVELGSEPMEMGEEGYQPFRQTFPIWLIFGLVLGITAAYLREYFDTTISTEYDIRRFLNWETMGIVPREMKRDILLPKLSVRDPFSEIFNTVSTVLTSRLLAQGPEQKVVMVTSALEKEGKSTVSTNLSTALARRGYKTLLVDADLRASKLPAFFDLEVPRGFSDVVSLAGADLPTAGDIESCLFPTLVEDLFLLAGGGARQNPIKVLESPKFRSLMEILKKQFDYVVIDTPPLLNVGDALLIARHADAVLFVIGAGISDRQSMKWAKHLVETVTPHVLGAVLNRASLIGGEYYYYYYGYGHATKRVSPT